MLCESCLIKLLKRKASIRYFPVQGSADEGLGWGGNSGAEARKYFKAVQLQMQFVSQLSLLELSDTIPDSMRGCERM